MTWDLFSNYNVGSTSDECRIGVMSDNVCFKTYKFIVMTRVICVYEKPSNM